MPRPKDRRGVWRALGACAALGLVLGIAPSNAGAACCTAGPVGSPTGWLRLRTTGYLFQSTDEYDVALDRFGAYQEFDGAVSGLARGRLALRVAGRFADDLYLKERVTDRSRLYVGHVEARPGPCLTARLGRQFIQEGSTGLTLDGLWLAARPDPRWQVHLWGGAQAPLGRTFDFGRMPDEGAWGARVACRPYRGVSLAASGAYRERDGRVAARPVGVEGQFTMIPRLRGVRAVGRVEYDLELEKWNRAEALAQWHPGVGLPVVAAQVIDRRPTIDAASYFARFVEDAMRIRMGRASVRYDHRSGFGAEAEWLGTYVGRRTATRIGGSLILPVGRVGYSARVGAAGEENRWFGNLGYAVLPWVWLEAGATLLTYAVLEDAPESDEHDLTTAYGRVRAEPLPGVGVRLEVQNVKNPDVDHDVRFLAGLDLTTGFGASRFGLQPGCCGSSSGGRQR